MFFPPIMNYRASDPLPDKPKESKKDFWDLQKLEAEECLVGDWLYPSDMKVKIDETFMRFRMIDPAPPPCREYTDFTKNELWDGLWQFERKVVPVRKGVSVRIWQRVI